MLPRRSRATRPWRNFAPRNRNSSAAPIKRSASDVMAGYPPARMTGPRLVLRPPVLDDAGALFQRVARDPQVTKYLLWTPHPDVATTQRVITERMNVDPHLRTWVMVLQHSDEIVGMISCGRHGYFAEIGYCVGRRWWGKG